MSVEEMLVAMSPAVVRLHIIRLVIACVPVSAGIAGQVSGSTELCERVAAYQHQVGDAVVAGEAEGFLFRLSNAGRSLDDVASLEERLLANLGEGSFRQFAGQINSDNKVAVPEVSRFRVVWDGEMLREELYGRIDVVTGTSSAALVNNHTQILVADASVAASRAFLRPRSFLLLHPYTASEHLSRFSLDDATGVGAATLTIPPAEGFAGVELVVDCATGAALSYSVMDSDSGRVILASRRSRTFTLDDPDHVLSYVRHAQLADGVVVSLECLLVTRLQIGLSISPEEFVLPASTGQQVFDTLGGSEVFRVPNEPVEDVVAYCLSERAAGDSDEVVESRPSLVLLSMVAFTVLAGASLWWRSRMVRRVS